MRRFATIFGVIVLLLVGAVGQVLLSRHRPYAAAEVNEGVMATLGGFRSIAAEAIWWRANKLEREGRFGELVQLATMLTYLEPHDSEVWNYTSWNLAYNISARMPRLEDRWPWVHEGIKLLRDQGRKWNPEDADIYRELASLFEMKVGMWKSERCPEIAAPLYQREWRKLVETVAARDRWEELAMEPARMREVERLYGITDWGDGNASAIYWAHQGLEFADARQRRQLQEIIRQCKRLYELPAPAAGAEGVASDGSTFKERERI